MLKEAVWANRELTTEASIPVVSAGLELSSGYCDAPEVAAEAGRIAARGRVEVATSMPV